MSQERQATDQYVTKLNEQPSLMDHRFDILLWQYQRLTVRLGNEPLVARSLSLILLLATLVLHPRSERVGLYSLSLASVVIATYWWSIVRILERRQEKLENLLLQDSGFLRTVMVEWRHDNWKHSRTSFVLRLEPFIWSFLIIISCVIQYLLSVIGHVSAL